MRIWAFPSFYPIDRPGYTFNGIFAHRQYKGLIENGAELKVIFPVAWSPIYPVSLLHPQWKRLASIGYPKERMYDGIKVYQPRVPNMKPSRLHKNTLPERYTETIVKFFRDNKIELRPDRDVFYSQWLPDSALVQKAAHILGVKSAILSIGDDVVQWPHGNEHNHQLFIKTMNEADLIFSCADYLGKEANRVLGKDLPFYSIRWGVDHSFFKPVSESEQLALKKQRNIPGDRLVILNIGTASPRKGWLDLFDALHEVKKVNDNFVVVAVHTGAPQFDFKTEAGKRGLSDNFIDIGEVKPSELNKVYNMADIFCLPSHSEGMANVVVEACSSGLPVITTTVGGHSELIDSGKNGVLLPPQQPAILAENLLDLMQDPGKRKKYGEAARYSILHNWGNYAESTKLLYEKLLSLCKV